VAKALTLFLPYVLPAVTGCSEPLALQALNNACVEFCKQTDIVQRISSQNIVAATQDYTVTVPTDMVLARVLGAAWQGTPLESAPTSEVTDPTALTGATIGDATLVSGTPVAWFQKTPYSTTISLAPVPDEALTNGLTIKASFTPTRAALSVEDVLFDEYVSDIASGALAELMAMPGQSFTSPLAAGHARRFAAGVSAAGRHAMYGKQPHNLRVRPRPFA